jgi:uncharacterized protein (TIGR02246 family)
MGLTAVGCIASSTHDGPPLTEAERSEIADTITRLITQTAQAFNSDDCEDIANVSTLGDARFVLAAEDQIITFESRDQMIAMCTAIKRDRLSAEEDIQEQTVHVVSADVAYIVTRNVYTMRWRDGRTEVRPGVETAIFAREDDRWRLLYQHQSWRVAESTPGG